MAAPGENKWKSLTKMLYARVYFPALVRDGLIYCIGGCDDSGQPIDWFDCYNPKNDKWKSLSPMPTKRAAPSCVIIGDNLIVVGGISVTQGSERAVELYNFLTKSWVKLNHLPLGLSGVTSVVVDEKMVAIGGSGENTSPVNSIHQLHIKENAWSELPSMSVERYCASAHIHGDCMYVMGGRQGKEPVNAFERLDFRTNDWETLPDIPSIKRVFSGYAATSKYMIYVGGMDVKNPIKPKPVNCVDVWDFESEKWVDRTQMPTKRADCGIVQLNDVVYVIGGALDEKSFTKVESFNPDMPPDQQWNTLPDMPTGRFAMTTVVIGNRIFVMGGMLMHKSAAVAAAQQGGTKINVASNHVEVLTIT